tara:strand:- start:1081 stop:1686 length:606 start_codon:yes stop_codon:yes gene_type:complete
MTDTGKCKLTLRLPKVLEDHIRSFAAIYDLSLNDAVKFTLIQHHLSISSDKPNIQSEVKHDLTHEVNTKDFLTTNNEVKHDPASEVKKTTPSRAPSIISNYDKVYKINSNNTITFLSADVESSWLAYKKYRREIRKPITKSAEKFQQRYIDKVLKSEGEVKLMHRFHEAIRKGWSGFVFDNENLNGQEQKQPATKFSKDDI